MFKPGTRIVANGAACGTVTADRLQPGDDRLSVAPDSNPDARVLYSPHELRAA